MARETLTVSDGVRLSYQLDGPRTAPVLALSNSLGTTLDMWAPQMEVLSSRFRVLRYDSRGHGASEAPPGEYAMSRLGQDAVDLIDAIGVDQVAFCGLSMGGMVGQWVGAHAPARISRLVLCNTSAHMAAAGWQTRIDQVRASGIAAIADLVIERWFTPDFIIEHATEVAPLRAALLATDPVGYAGCCAAIRDMDQRPILQKITSPCLVIAGSLDAATPPEQSEEIAAAVPGARLETLSAAHLSNTEQAASFTALLGVFLSKNTTAPA